jgi:hypothetical protein
MEEGPVANQQFVDLSSGNLNAPFAQLFEQQRLSNLAVMMLVEAFRGRCANEA